MIDHMFAPLKKYADFTGRARRADYWWFVLFYAVVFSVLNFIGMQINLTFLPMIFLLAVICPLIAAGWRRMHDTGRAGWWIIVPIANIIFAASPGTVGPNQYGPDPKGQA